jgi:hypothetical protein
MKQRNVWHPVPIKSQVQWHNPQRSVRCQQNTIDVQRHLHIARTSSVLHRPTCTAPTSRHWLHVRMCAYRILQVNKLKYNNISYNFPQCVAKGSCFLGRGSGGGGLFAGRFRFATTSHCLWSLWGMSDKVMCWNMWKCILRGGRGTLWHSSESCFELLQWRRPTVHGECQKRWCVGTCESAFRVACVGLCGTFICDLSFFTVTPTACQVLQLRCRCRLRWGTRRLFAAPANTLRRRCDCDALQIQKCAQTSRWRMGRRGKKSVTCFVAAVYAFLSLQHFNNAFGFVASIRFMFFWSLKDSVLRRRCCAGHCRALSRPDVLESILEAVDEGFREMRGWRRSWERCGIFWFVKTTKDALCCKHTLGYTFHVHDWQKLFF